MTDRLPMQRIEIPARDLVSDAMDIVTRELIAMDADPRKVMRNAMGAELIRLWTKRDMELATFRHSIRNLLVLNPGLKLGAI